MSRFKERAEGNVLEAIKEHGSWGHKPAFIAIAYALLWIGEILEKYLKEIATNTKRIRNS